EDAPVEDDQQIDVGMQAEEAATVAAERGDGERRAGAGTCRINDAADERVDAVREADVCRGGAQTALDVGDELLPCRVQQRGQLPTTFLRVDLSISRCRHPPPAGRAREPGLPRPAS